MLTACRRCVMKPGRLPAVLVKPKVRKPLPLSVIRELPAVLAPAEKQLAGRIQEDGALLELLMTPGGNEAGYRFNSEGVDRRARHFEGETADIRADAADREADHVAGAEEGGASRAACPCPSSRVLKPPLPGASSQVASCAAAGEPGRKAHAERNRSQQRGAPAAVMTPNRARQHPFWREPGRQQRGRRQAGRPARSGVRCGIVHAGSGHFSFHPASSPKDLIVVGSFVVGSLVRSIEPALLTCNPPSERGGRTHARFARP